MAITKKICGGGVVIAAFEYKAGFGFKWWRGNAWCRPRREIKKKVRKEDTHTYQGAERRERNEKKKKN